MALPSLTLEQEIEMLDLMQELKRTGDPVAAAAIQVAFDEGRYFTGQAKKEVELPDPPNLNAKKEDWFAFAVEVSDIDVDVLEAATRNDIITMLRANGLIEKN